MKNTQIISKDGYLFSELQAGNEPAGYTPLQSVMSPYVTLIEIFFWILWVTVLAYVIRELFAIKN